MGLLGSKSARVRPNEPFSRVTGLLLRPCGVLYFSFYFSLFLFWPLILIYSYPLAPSSFFSFCLLFLSSMGRPCNKNARGIPNGPLSIVFISLLCPCSVLPFFPIGVFFLLCPAILVSDLCVAPPSCFSVCVLSLSSMGYPCGENSRGRPNGPFSLAFDFSVPSLCCPPFIPFWVSLPSLPRRPCFCVLVCSPLPFSPSMYTSSLPLGAPEKKRQGSPQRAFCFYFFVKLFPCLFWNLLLVFFSCFCICSPLLFSR